MKNVVIGAAVAAISFSAGAVDVNGSVEYVMSENGGVYDITSDDTFVTFSSMEDLGEGVTAFANLSLDVDSEATTEVTNRDAYVGISTGAANVALGRMTNVQKDLGGVTVDIFEGNGHNVTGATRVENAVKGGVDLGSVSLVGSTVADGAAGENDADSYEVGVMGDLGAVKGGVVYAKDRNTAVVTKTVAGAVDVDFATVGASLDRVGEIDTVNVVASATVGAHTIKLGYADVEAGADTLTGEIAHNFSQRTSAYVNVQDVDTAANEVYQVGVRHNF